MLHDLKTLILSFHPIIVIETVEEERVSGIISTACADLSLPLLDWSLTRGLRVGSGDSIHGTTSPQGALEHLRVLDFEAVVHLKDFATHFESPELARSFREVAEKFSRNHSTLILTGRSVRLPGEVEHLAVHLDLALPGRDELRDLLRSVVSTMRSRMGVRVQLTPDDATRLVECLSGLTIDQARQVLAYAMVEDGVLTVEDVRTIIERKAKILRSTGILELYPAQENRFEIGGFGKLREWLDRAKLGFSQAARRYNLQPPKGILLVGVQGCGKSLAAKVIAREWQMPLLKLDAGRLYDKYVGESEKNLREAIRIAETMAPTVLWIDEIEKGFGSGRSSSQDGGLSARLFGTLLTWLQEKKETVFVIATANHLDILPPELLRKGRFDEIFFVDLPDPDERREIFRIHIEARNQHPVERFDLDTLVEKTNGFSGAEIEQAIVSAVYRALHADREVDTNLLVEEIEGTIPLSVSRAEDLAELRKQAT
ncbi:MAG: AAA family ATPase, partial [Thermoanaerobaculia bacterium]|nr:AAA family ATPase [Thermoanaerobaculia bacterium]